MKYLSSCSTILISYLISSLDINLSGLPILITAGSLRIDSAHLCTSLGQVAVKKRFYLLGDVINVIIFLISSSKPISSILSASSRTNIVVLSNFATIFPVLKSVIWRKSKSLPGVATITSYPLISSAIYGPLDDPP